MCTVTYLPTPTGFILTSNRDESPLRAALQLQKQSLTNGVELLFPQDTKAGGTWISVASNNKLLVLLNGAFEPHQRVLPYRRSRGLVVLDFFNYPTAAQFLQEYDFEQIEPFTMVIYSEDTLTEFRWDAQQKHIRPLDVKGQYIWSSAPLYTSVYQGIREQLFQNWVAQYPDLGYQTKDVVQFLHKGKTGSEADDFVMNRFNIVRTVSITCIEKTKQQFALQHHDLLHQQLIEDQLVINHPTVGD